MVSQLLSFLRMTFAPKYAQTCYAPTCTARKRGGRKTIRYHGRKVAAERQFKFTHGRQLAVVVSTETLARLLIIDRVS